jgi:hypothetical protein
MGLTPASGFLVQSQAGDAKHGNFEVVVPDLRHNGLSHYWRDNGGNGEWVIPTAKIGEARYTSASIAESDYKHVSGNEQGNLEVLARQEEPAGARLDFAWRDNGGAWAWNGPVGVKLPHGVAAPALVAERLENGPGPLRAVVPVEAGGFLEFERVTTPNLPWQEVGYADGGTVQGVAFMLSFVRSSEWPSRVDVYGDRVVAAVAADGTLQLYARYGGSPPNRRRWEGPFRFGAEIPTPRWDAVFRGRPSIIMSSFNQSQSGTPFSPPSYGNYELVAALRQGGIAHIYKDNGDKYGAGTDLSLNWHPHSTFGQGRIYDEVSLIQSNYGGEHGHLEVAARRSDMVGFDFYWRDDDYTTWHGPNYIR